MEGIIRRFYNSNFFKMGTLRQNLKVMRSVFKMLFQFEMLFLLIVVFNNIAVNETKLYIIMVFIFIKL